MLIDSRAAGMRHEQMNGSLERFFRDVAPRLKSAAQFV